MHFKDNTSCIHDFRAHHREKRVFVHVIVIFQPKEMQTHISYLRDSKEEKRERDKDEDKYEEDRRKNSVFRWISFHLIDHYGFIFFSNCNRRINDDDDETLFYPVVE